MPIADVRPIHRLVKLEFHDANTDTDTDTDEDRRRHRLAKQGYSLTSDTRYFLVRIVARMSACRSAFRRNNFRKSRVSDVSATILVRVGVSVGVGVVEFQLD